jgi:hypothetical protein
VFDVNEGSRAEYCSMLRLGGGMTFVYRCFAYRRDWLKAAHVEQAKLSLSGRQSMRISADSAKTVMSVKCGRLQILDGTENCAFAVLPLVRLPTHLVTYQHLFEQWISPVYIKCIITLAH